MRAFARSATAMTLSDPRLEKVQGDATRQQDIDAALGSVDAVIVALGVGLGELIKPVHLFSAATRVLIPAMKAQTVKRLICVTGFGAGEVIPRFLTGFIRRVYAAIFSFCAGVMPPMPRCPAMMCVCKT